jgi:hypothetical protein
VSKKDYVAIAAELRALATHDLFAYDHVRILSAKLADIFKADNARFDRERFLPACGIRKDDQ